MVVMEMMIFWFAGADWWTNCWWWLGTPLSRFRHVTLWKNSTCSMLFFKEGLVLNHKNTKTQIHNFVSGNCPATWVFPGSLSHWAIKQVALFSSELIWSVFWSVFWSAFWSVFWSVFIPFLDTLPQEPLSRSLQESLCREQSNPINGHFSHQSWFR